MEENKYNRMRVSLGNLNLRRLGVILISPLLIIFILGCASEELKEPVADGVQFSCTLNQLDGECRFIGTRVGEGIYNNIYTICSMGTCSAGDCINGKGTLTYPAGSKLEGTFKKGILNGAGGFEGCGSSFTGIFKDNQKDKGILLTRVKKYNAEIVQYYEGSFQNEMRNGKGIYYSSLNKWDDKKIYDGIWKNDIKNGAFVVYSDFDGNFPISENGVVFKSSYSDTKKITYVNDRNKEEIDQEERDRKYQAIEDAKEKEENRKRAAREAEYERKQEAKQRKYEAEEERARRACEATKSEYSPQCKEYNRKY
jgi:hypothetical protein